jgi:hypothetical protein
MWELVLDKDLILEPWLTLEIHASRTLWLVRAIYLVRSKESILSGVVLYVVKILGHPSFLSAEIHYWCK